MHDVEDIVEHYNGRYVDHSVWLQGWLSFTSKDLREETNLQYARDQIIWECTIWESIQ